MMRRVALRCTAATAASSSVVLMVSRAALVRHSVAAALPQRSFSSAAAPSSAEAAAPAPSDSSRLCSNSRLGSMAFARWLSGTGVRFNSSTDGKALFGVKRLAHAQDNWFLAAASRTITKGETVFRLPKAITLAPSTPLADPIASAELAPVLASVPRELWPLRNAVRLVYEYALMTSPPVNAKSADSFFAPYINLLPASYSTIPLFWSASQLAALQYPPVLTQVKLRANAVREVASKLAALPTALGRDVSSVATAGRVAWAMSSVSSRAFQLAPAECSNLPLIDLCNHSFENNCKVSLDGSDVVVTAIRDIGAGEELQLNYGFHSNDAFLLNYGFILDDNPADTLMVARSKEGLELAAEMSGEATSQAPWKMALLQQLGVGGPSASVEAPSHFTIMRDAVDPQLIAAIKILVAPLDHPETERTLEHFIRGAGSLVGADEGASTIAAQEWTPPQQDLAKALTPAGARILFSYLSLLQSSFATSLQQDVEELSQLVQQMLTAEPNPQLAEHVQRMEIAIRFRIGKKRLLQEQMKRAQKNM